MADNLHHFVHRPALPWDGGRTALTLCGEIVAFTNLHVRMDYTPYLKRDGWMTSYGTVLPRCPRCLHHVQALAVIDEAKRAGT